MSSTTVNAVKRDGELYVSLKDLRIALLTTKSAYLIANNAAAADAIDFVLSELEDSKFGEEPAR